MCHVGEDKIATCAFVGTCGFLDFVSSFNLVLNKDFLRDNVHALYGMVTIPINFTSSSREA